MREGQIAIVDGGYFTATCPTCKRRDQIHVNVVMTDGVLTLLRGGANLYCQCGGSGRVEIDVLVSQDPLAQPVAKLKPLGVS